MTPTYRVYNVVRLVYGEPETAGVWINGTRLNGCLSFAYRLDLSGQWVDITALWGQVRVLGLQDDEQAPPVAAPMARQQRTSIKPVVTASTSVEYAPGEWVATRVHEVSYATDYVTVRFSIRVGTPYAGVEIEGVPVAAPVTAP